MGWQDAAVVQGGSPNVRPAWMSAPVAAPGGAPQPEGAGGVVHEALSGLGDLGIDALSHVATPLVGSAVGLINRLAAAASGGDPEAASQAAHDYVNQHFGYSAQTPVGQAVTGAIGRALAPVGAAAGAAGSALEQGGAAIGIPQGETQGALHELGDIANVVPAVGALGEGAAASREAATLASENAADPAAANAGFRTQHQHATAAEVAGQSGKDALTLHNQRVGNTLAASEAGVANGPMNYDALEAARTAPNAVYGRVADALPAAPLSPAAARLVQSAGGADRITQGTPDAITNIEGLKSQLLQPGRSFSGNEVINEMRGLRQEGYANLASEDVSKQQLGKAQLDMSRALEQHVTDTLPPGSPVSTDQLQTARTALAKNYAVQAALRGNDVDMGALARVQRGDPGLLTGGLQTTADFANKNPAITGLASRVYSAPSYLKDVLGVPGTHEATSFVSPSFWSGLLSGKALARRLLTGNTDAAVAAARAAYPPVLGDAFAPLDPSRSFDLQPPPGAASAAPIQQTMDLPPGGGSVLHPTGGLTASTPVAPTPAPTQGGIPLADLLAHGVEQPPPAGLSLVPAGLSPQQGIPFSPNLEHAAGGLTLAPEDAWFKGPAPDLSDLAAVKSQGVPEGIVQRANNASGESAASLEAINRGTRPLAIIDPDGNERTVLRDVTQADQRAPKGHLLIDTSTGEIIDRGGLSQSQANGLRNRWATQGRALGDHFMMGRAGG